MQHPRPPATDHTAPHDDGFFIPDLCAPQAVFLAVLLAELVVLLHVLASRAHWRSLTGAFWVRDLFSCSGMRCCASQLSVV